MNRARTTAMGTPFIREPWVDNTRYARRSHIFGPIQSLRAEVRAAGCTPFWQIALAGTLGLAGLAGVLVLLGSLVS